MRRLVVSTGVLAAALTAAATLVWVDVLDDQRTQASAATPTRYAPPTVEVAPGVDVGQAEVAAYVQRITNDPRGWRTDLDQFTLRIVPPGTRDAHGINFLIGRSFRDENLAIVTADAWVRTGPQFVAVGGTLDQQRTWVVLHELGHLLGHEHTACPGSGPAPIMRSATYEIGDCDVNAWPNP